MHRREFGEFNVENIVCDRIYFGFTLLSAHCIGYTTAGSFKEKGNK